VPRVELLDRGAVVARAELAAVSVSIRCRGSRPAESRRLSTLGFFRRATSDDRLWEAQATLADPQRGPPARAPWGTGVRDKFGDFQRRSGSVKGSEQRGETQAHLQEIAAAVAVI
jgi:hypothetical protein